MEFLFRLRFSSHSTSLVWLHPKCLQEKQPFRSETTFHSPFEPTFYEQESVAVFTRPKLICVQRSAHLYSINSNTLNNCEKCNDYNKKPRLVVCKFGFWCIYLLEQCQQHITFCQIHVFPNVQQQQRHLNKVNKTIQLEFNFTTCEIQWRSVRFLN